jgi:hypothetical protein
MQLCLQALVKLQKQQQLLLLLPACGQLGARVNREPSWQN